MALETEGDRTYLLLSSAENKSEVPAVPESSLGPVPPTNYCRFCAEKIKYTDLLDLSKDVSTHGEYVKILKFFKIDFVELSQSNKLPWTTCLSCYYSFQNAYSFFLKVKAAQRILLSVFHGIKSENVDQDIKFENYIDDGIDDESTHNDDVFMNDDMPFTNDAGPNTVFTEENLVNQETNAAPPLVDSVKPEKAPKKVIKDSPKPKKTRAVKKPVVKRKAKKIKREKSSDCSDDDIPLNKRSKKDYSWTSYSWYCVHCRKKFRDMEELRYHSKEDHNKCYGFDCVDCRDEFNQFSSFIEHVRQHRDVLRYFCAFCNMKFNSPADCNDHSVQHWLGEEKICEMCGEVFPNAAALKSHKKLYKRRKLPRRSYTKKPKVVDSPSPNASWSSYSWSCQDCNAKCISAEELRLHVRMAHEKCFAIKCADCLKLMVHYRGFVQHVWKHRPYLRKYCQYCDIYIGDAKQLSAHVEAHLSGPNRPCEGCGEIFQDNHQMLTHMKQFEAPRSHKTATEEDLTCDLCGKVFGNIVAIRRHRETHNERVRDHTCEECGRAFFSKHLLAGHLKTHNPDPEMCLICKRIFKNKMILKHHVKTHIAVKMFACDQCGRTFQKKTNLKCHIMTHSGEMPYKCSVCEKQFRLRENLKTHMHQHTGDRPYPCKMCEKAFTNWANCNKHMIRKHGIPLAKSKRTERGRVAIDSITGKPMEMATDENTRLWMEKVLENKMKRKVPEDKGLLEANATLVRSDMFSKLSLPENKSVMESTAMYGKMSVPEDKNLMDANASLMRGEVWKT